MRRRAILVAVVLALLAAAPAAAAPSLTTVGMFDQPVHVAGPAGDAARLFVVERQGVVRIVVNGQTASTPFLDATADVGDAGGEEGLLSIAFAPDYASSGLFYVFYTDNAGDLVVREGTRTGDPNQGRLGRVVFTVAHPGQSNHNGGQLAFGFDALLYASTGDGGGQGDPGDDAQNPNSRLGKILRLDPRDPGSLEAWALGLRNPWRFSFDRVTGDAVIGDVGGSVNEEVDFAPAGVPAGRNYGWVRCEGDQPTCPPGTVRPVLNLPHPAGYTGVIGGFVVRDPGLPTLQGRYVFGDLSKTTVLSAALGVETIPRPEPTLPVSAPTSFGEDGCGHVYVALNGGAVSRIQDGALGPCVVPPIPATCCAPRPGAGQPVSPAADTVGCTIRAGAPRRAQRILRRGKRLAIRLRADEACTITLRAVRFHTKRVRLKANEARIVRLEPTKKGLRRLRRAAAHSDRHRLRITVRVSGRDAAGNPSSARARPLLR